MTLRNHKRKYYIWSKTDYWETFSKNIFVMVSVATIIGSWGEMSNLTEFSLFSKLWRLLCFIKTYEFDFQKPSSIPSSNAVSSDMFQSAVINFVSSKLLNAVTKTDLWTRIFWNPKDRFWIVNMHPRRKICHKYL